MLYEHLGLGSLPGENVLIASALWGFVRPSDRIPAYRLSMGATLPRIPSLPALWRDPLRRAMPDSGLIVDMRSGSYAAAWKPKQATVVGVRAFVDGKTVSHMVKATRGDVARILLTSGETPESAGGRGVDRPPGRPAGRAQRAGTRSDVIACSRCVALKPSPTPQPAGRPIADGSVVRTARAQPRRVATRRES